MKTIVRLSLKALLAIAVSSMATSCRKDLCYTHYRALKINFEWDQVWERNNGVDQKSLWEQRDHDFEYSDLDPDKADDVTILVYNFDNLDDVMVMYSDNVSADVAIPSGINSIMMFNENVKYVDFNNLSERHSATITAHEKTRTTYTPKPGELTVREPDMLYGCYLSQLDEIAFHDSRELDVLMTPLTFKYEIHFMFTRGVHHVYLARGALTGMARGVYMRDGGTTEETATILFDDCVECEHGGLRTDILSFGLPDFVDSDFNGPEPSRVVSRDKPAQKAASNLLTLEVMLTNGSLKYFYFDVTDQLALQPTGGVIFVDGLEIDDDENIGSGGGIIADLDDWSNVVDVHIPFEP
jgi:hypothetical protein